MSRSEVEALLSKRPNSSYGKASQFDVLGTRAVGVACNLDEEDPLLIDPCKRDPINELLWDFSTELTLVEPKMGVTGYSQYGAYTIRTCALNRAELVLDRIPTVRTLRVIRTHILNRLDAWRGNAPELSDILAEVDTLSSFAQPDQPYAGMATAFIADFQLELDRWRDANGLPPF